MKQILLEYLYFSIYCFNSCVMYSQTSWNVNDSLNLIFFK